MPAAVGVWVNVRLFAEDDDVAQLEWAVKQIVEALGCSPVDVEVTFGGWGDGPADEPQLN